MSLCEPEHREMSEAEIRTLEIGRALFVDNVKAATSLRLNLGAQGLLNPNNEGVIREVFKAAKISSLKRMGVLDEDGKVIPGQEQYLDIKMVSR